MSIFILIIEVFPVLEINKCTHFFYLILPIKVNIIPACAGITLILRLLILVIRDHPRVCGYNSVKIRVK